MQLDDISEKIKRSAKLRLDWLDFENSLIEAFGTEEGTRIADNMLYPKIPKVDKVGNYRDFASLFI